MNNVRSPPSYFLRIQEIRRRTNMKNKIYDYDNKTFKRVVKENGNYIYYIKVDNDYIEVKREVYLELMRSYAKIKYDREREVEKSVQYFEDIDQATSFVLSTNSNNFCTQIYIKDLANQAIKEIYKLPDKYRNIAICLFIDELSERATAIRLSVPKSYST